MTTTSRLVTTLLAAALSASTATANPGQDGEGHDAGGEKAAGEFQLQKDLQIHGFGNWAYGDSDGVDYLSSEEDGEADDASFALNVSATPWEHVRVEGQVLFENRDEGTEVELNFAFAEWDVSDRLKLHAGRVKQPAGIYGEIFDVGTLRPFLNLPQGVYGPSGLTSRALNGLALTGRLSLGGDWKARYDVYGGALNRSVLEPWELLEEAEEDEEDEGEEEGEEASAPVEEKDLERVLGGHLLLYTPVEGLTVGLSLFRGEEEASEEVVTGEEPAAGTVLSWGLQAEYLVRGWTVRAEAQRFEEENEMEVDAAYLELAYELTERWQLAARWDWSDTEVLELEEVEDLGSLTQHRDLAVAVNYWVNPNLVFKLELHDVEGSRFALTEDFLESGELEDLQSSSRVLQFGVNFSF